ncbi:MAG: L-threonylcarbamoyladenylate synthase [Pseudohongiellaceae bacterium]|jgi:L-threonylcarbamoyladenylate synthase
MITRQLNANNVSHLQEAKTILKDGGTVAVPTETVYGLAADASNPVAVAAIFAAKGRPANHPLIVHIASVDELENWAIDIPEQAYKLAQVFWPGPLTMLLKKASHVSPVVTGGLDTIGVRVPSQPILQQILQSSGLGLAAPSANPYKRLSPTSAKQVLQALDGRINGILDGGECTIGVESTIVDLTNEEVTVLRAGPISPSELSSVLNQPVSAPAQHSIAVPGNVADHYQPKTPLYLISRQDMLAKMRLPSESSYFVVLADFPAGEIINKLSNKISMPKSKAEFARVLYKTLHQLDGKNLKTIWFETPPHTEQWLDVNDRLVRASYSI